MRLCILLKKKCCSSSRDLSDQSICVSKPSTQLLSHVTMYYDFLPMYFDFRYNRTWPSGFITMTEVTVHVHCYPDIVITIWVALKPDDFVG